MKTQVFKMIMLFAFFWVAAFGAFLLSDDGRDACERIHTPATCTHILRG